MPNYPSDKGYYVYRPVDFIKIWSTITSLEASHHIHVIVRNGCILTATQCSSHTPLQVEFGFPQISGCGLVVCMRVCASSEKRSVDWSLNIAKFYDEGFSFWLHQYVCGINSYNYSITTLNLRAADKIKKIIVLLMKDRFLNQQKRIHIYLVSD